MPREGPSVPFCWRLSSVSPRLPTHLRRFATRCFASPPENHDSSSAPTDCILPAPRFPAPISLFRSTFTAIYTLGIAATFRRGECSAALQCSLPRHPLHLVPGHPLHL